MCNNHEIFGSRDAFNMVSILLKIQVHCYIIQSFNQSILKTIQQPFGKEYSTFLFIFSWRVFIGYTLSLEYSILIFIESSLSLSDYIKFLNSKNLNIIQKDSFLILILIMLTTIDFSLSQFAYQMMLITLNCKEMRDSISQVRSNESSSDVMSHKRSFEVTSHESLFEVTSNESFMSHENLFEITSNESLSKFTYNESSFEIT